MKILVAGDFCPTYRVAKAFDKEDYASVLQDVRKITAEADYSIANFECPVVTGDAKPIEKLGPNLRSSSHGVDAIKWAGFDCVTLANNHFMDFGEDGARNTFATLGTKKIDYVGAGVTLNDAEQTLYKTINGKRLAIINCCEHEFGIASDSTYGTNPLNPIRQYYAIRDARNQADYVLVIVHGGCERFQLPSPRMVETYRFFIEAGADVVLNHHQHCYSGYERYMGEPIFYGLGNLCFDDEPICVNKLWNYGFMVMLDFSANGLSFELFPYKQCAEEPKVKLLPQDAFDKDLEEISAVIANPKALNQAIDEYYDSCSQNYSNILEPLYNRFYQSAKYRGWLPSFISKKRKLTALNFIQCESHRDKLVYSLSNR